MADPWYRVDDLPPPLGVRVRVNWDGRVFEAARVRHPSAGHTCWLTHHRTLGGVFLPLPAERVRTCDPHSPWAGFQGLTGGGPSLYQPVNPMTWAVPLPSPVAATGSVSMVSTPVSEPMSPGDVASGQFWRDPLAMVYEPAGQVSLRMAEARVMRAVAWCGAGHGLTLRTVTPAALLAQMADRAAGEDVTRDRARFVPLPQDHDDFDTAMSWYVQLNPPESWSRTRRPWSLNRRQRVILWRSLAVPLSFGEIGYELRVSAPRAREILLAALADCWRAANGLRIGRQKTPAERRKLAVETRQEHED